MSCRAFIVILALLFMGNYEAQNLVPNGSFEEFEECPTTLYADLFGIGWSSTRFSCDYYNSCADDCGVSVPCNVFGYQEAFDGSAYCGFLGYKVMNPELKEHFLTELNEPLIIGETYYFSMWLSPGEAERDLGTNGMGCMLTNTPYFHEFVDLGFEGNPSPLDRAIISTEEVITDTVGWTQVKGNFVADSAYQYLVIGGFNLPDGNDTLHLRPNAFSGEAYYFVDDVRLSTDSAYAFSSEPSTVEESVFDEYLLFPNPFSDELWLKDEVLGLRRVEFFDARGAKVHQSEVTGKRIKGLAHLQAGIYILRFQGDKGMIGYSRVVKLE